MTDASPNIPRHLCTDLHLHSTFSDGRADVPTMVATARRIGFEIAISDHYSVPYGMQGDQKLTAYLDTLEQHNIYRAVELDLGNEQPMTPANRARLDYCVGSMHGVSDEHGDRVTLDRNSAAATRHYMQCVVAQFIRGVHTGLHAMIGHPTYLPEVPRQGQDDLWEPEYRAALIAAALETGVALELSTRYQAPNPVFVREALAAGVRFAVASDGHSPQALGAIDYPRRLIAELEIPPERFFLPERRLRSDV